METEVSIKVPGKIIKALGVENIFATSINLQAYGFNLKGPVLLVSNQTLSHGDLVATAGDEGILLWRCLTALSEPCNQVYAIVVEGSDGSSRMLRSAKTRQAFKVAYWRDTEGNWLAIDPQPVAPAFDGDLSEIMEFDRLHGTGEVYSTGETVSLTSQQFDVLEPMRAEALARLGLVEPRFLGIANA
jgi:hypothetical protein